MAPRGKLATGTGPLRNADFLENIEGPIGKSYPHLPEAHPKVILSHDLLDIRRCDILVACLLDTDKVSIGTVAEINYAKALGKTIITVMELSGNIHDHPFVTEQSDYIVETVSEAAEIVNDLLGEGI